MSPEIRKNGLLIADVPDENGLYQALDGSPLWVDLHGIDAGKRKQEVILEGPAIGGLRIVGLTLEGKGNSRNTKKGGDGKEPTLDVTLHYRPIRVTYSPIESRIVDVYNWSVVDYGDRVTRHNPRWIRR